ncbi:hypothetical protein F5884DRAFT_863605 [Xylogone sp. PMI_703]|nr:hypothetical protein F5884DRAFT_863605 [Xylogone sp. PMI_703]
MSSCSTSDKGVAHQNIAQLCADVKAQGIATPESTISGRNNWPDNGPWSGGWGVGCSGCGPFGGSWGPWGSSGAWTAGPWTSWWGGSECPDGNWPGWTSDTWSTAAPWTTWTACTATTTATDTYTTISGSSVVTGVSYGIKVAQQTGTTGASTGAPVESSAFTSDSPSMALTNKACARMAFISLIISLLVVTQE